jgi:hypothetical protein
METTEEKVVKTKRKRRKQKNKSIYLYIWELQELQNILISKYFFLV